MTSLLAIPLMAFLARASGGGVGAHILDKKGHKRGIMPVGLTWLPEALFGLCIGLAAGYTFGWWWTLTGLWAYFAMERGHSTVYNMKGWQSFDPTRIDSIEYPIRPIFYLFGWSIYQPAYSWACMGLKGLAIGLPIFPFGLLLAVLWPLAYYISVKINGQTNLAEWLSGAFAGLCIVLLLSL